MLAKENNLEINYQIFRLYNAAFARIPDPSGLEYWINQASPNIESRRTSKRIHSKKNFRQSSSANKK